jgi:AAA+ ATPase superfamily predicted ATPase
MSIEDIVGREDEKKLLTELFNKEERILYLLYGRRIGKSWLVTNFMNGRVNFLN